MTLSPIRSILVRLLAAYLLPTIAFFSLFGWLVYRVTAKSLEDGLGRQLISIAQAAAMQLRPEAILFLSPGDDHNRTSRRLKNKLQELLDRTGVARIFILDKQLRSRSDTRPSVLIGDHYYHAEADGAELNRVFKNRAAASILFVGSDGKMYKTGYAPVTQGQDVVAAVGVLGSADFYRDLDGLRNRLLFSGAVVLGMVTLLAGFLSRRLTRPLRTLAKEAARIGAGDLKDPIAVTGKDEVGLLASTMNEMRQGLFQRDQQMQMMLSGIAHEVRNPLGGIELFSGLLREDLEEDTEKLEHVHRIERELAYLKKVVGEFLDFARQSRPALLKVNLAALSKEIVELMQKDAKDKDITLITDGKDPTLAMGDADQLKRVLINLIRNAIQATAEGQKVTIRWGSNEADSVFWEIEDLGPGIPPDTLDKIFTPFFTTREKGTGLGLAFAKKIIGEHKGSITVTNNAEKGATFKLQLPRGTD